MRTDELEAAIVEPARQVGVEVDRAVVAELISGVSNRPTALPLLQFALTELYERRVAGVMLIETYQALGGLTGALAARADRIIERGDARDEELTRRIFSRLIAFSDSADREARRRAPIAEFGDDERTAWLIDEFVSARLLVVDRDEMTREPTVEVANEALLRDWPRLTSWIDEDRTDLRVRRIITTAASEWADADGDGGMVARGGRLDLVTDLRDRRDDLLNETERAWVDESVRIAETAAQRDRRGRRRTRTALATTAVLLGFAVAAAAGALVLRGRASQSERAAEARELVLEAEKAIESDPELAVLLGLEATAAFEDSTGAVPTATLQVLRSGIRSNHVRARFPGGGWVAVLGDGDALATSSGDGDIAIWDAAMSELVDEISIDGWSVVDAQTSADGLLVVASGDDQRHSIFRVDLDTGTVRQSEPDIPVQSATNVLLDGGIVAARPASDVVELRVGPDGETRTFDIAVDAEVYGGVGLVAFAIGDDASPGVALIDTATWERADLALAEFLPQYVAVSSAGGLVAVARQAGEVAVYNRTTGEPIWETMTVERAGAPVWSADDAYLVIGTEDDLIVIDAAEGRVAERLRVHDGGTWSYEFVGDTGLIASAGLSDGATLIVDPRPGTEGELPLAHDPLQAITIQSTPDGSVVAHDRRDYAVVDVEADRTLGGGTGLHVDGSNDFGMAVPVIDPAGRYVAVNDGVSRLRRLADGRTVWSAPTEWTIRGFDPDRKPRGDQPSRSGDERDRHQTRGVSWGRG